MCVNVCGVCVWCVRVMKCAYAYLFVSALGSYKIGHYKDSIIIIIQKSKTYR